MRAQTTFILLMLLGLLPMEACSFSTDSRDPLLPSAVLNNHLDAKSDPQGMQNGHNLLGFWTITLNRDNLTYEITPVRHVDFHLNVLSWLESGICSDCLAIPSMKHDQFNYSNLEVEIQIRHPFSMPNLTGFDAKGIVMFDGSIHLPSFGLLTSAYIAGDTVLLDADGFTTLYNPSTIGNGLIGYIDGKLDTKILPNATLNGFKNFYSSSNRHFYQAGDTITRTYKIYSPAPMTTFGYAVDVSWAKPTTPVTVPDSFPLAANCPEAYNISVDWNYALTTSKNSKSTLIIDVYDWQGGNTIGEVDVEGPFFWSGIKKATGVGGGPATKRFTVDIFNELAYMNEFPDGYPIVIRVLDTSSHPGQLIDNIAWQIVNMPVVINHAPICAALADTLNPKCGQIVTFTDSSTDQEGVGTIEESWWDWDNNGSLDEQGCQIGHLWLTSGTYYINHLVKDELGATDWLDQPIELIVKE